MRVCAISMKECWEHPEQGWTSYGGFPRQMTAIASLFDHMDLLIVRSQARTGGLPLPPGARIIAMREPKGVDARRKLDVLLNLGYYVSTMVRYIRQADVVHTPLPGDMPLLGLAIALVMRKPVIARYGGSWAATNQTTFMNRVTRTLMRLAARSSNVVIATGVDAGKPAEGMEWLFSTSLTADEVRRIQPSFDRGLQAPPKLIYAGRLSVEKGVYELIRAIHLLSERGVRPMPLLTMAGDGPDRKAIEGLARELDCIRHIRFTGQLNREELSEEFNRADIAVQPSMTESFGKAWIDAMVHGLPVITCNVGSARACIGQDGERGWVTQPGDAARLADAIQNALSGETDWPAMRRRCRAYSESFTIENWIAGIARMCTSRWNCSYQGKLIRQAS
jgi:glycosyltransferase involved in cell wall biosynthesis